MKEENQDGAVPRNPLDESWKERLTQEEMDEAKSAFLNANNVRNGVAAAVEAVLNLRAQGGNR